MKEGKMENLGAASNIDTQLDCPFLPGEVITRSGLYEICHYREPRTAVILTVNGFFPFCRSCGDKVRYKLLRAVPHISEDPDFKESVPADNPQIETATENPAFPVQLGLTHGFRFWQEPALAAQATSQPGD
jgi:hypothetical protein